MVRSSRFPFGALASCRSLDRHRIELRPVGFSVSSFISCDNIRRDKISFCRDFNIAYRKQSRRDHFMYIQINALSNVLNRYRIV